ncbi:hypothetical protein VSR68_06790 [Paraburkholderia phymatum]|uniref:hypothetical protein n=1 Tax=Paraburkholderia phymatum TaxID=148447 RepID=UPI003174CA16
MQSTYKYVTAALKRRTTIISLAFLVPAFLTALFCWPSLDWRIALGGVILSVIAGFIVMVCFDLVQVIADTLMPR